MYIVYILKCSDNTLYTGITNNLEKRLQMHEGKIPWWAKYMRGRLPFELMYTEEFPDRSCASKREGEIKKLSQKRKLCMIQSGKKRKFT